MTTESEPQLHRRSVLRLLGVSAGLTLAGCTGTTEEADEQSQDPEPEPEQESTDPEPLTHPVEFIVEHETEGPFEGVRGVYASGDGVATPYTDANGYTTAEIPSGAPFSLNWYSREGELYDMTALTTDPPDAAVGEYETLRILEPTTAEVTLRGPVDLSGPSR